MLREVLNLKGIRTIPFDFPTEPDPAEVKASLAKLALRLGTTLEAADEWRKRLLPARELVHKLDYLCYADNKVSGFENHYWLVSSSDFNGDYVKYQAELQKLLNTVQTRTPYPATELRLAYLGVPSVFGEELYPYLEQNEARVVFNEIQRQFSLPDGGADISQSYTSYTYPYPMEYRLRDIQTQLAERKIDGIIHYVQAFCHRAIGDIILRQKLPLPILTLEGNADFGLNQHQKTRLEAFLDMLKAKKQMNL
ncbi:possible subunit of benzoyl-CoA reductase/2-hydroxyglutaryl-CoA dehydratase [Dehalococcoides mccartyi]|nr:possible subunit of benzoyl-CoA reductase/2-hydroxyglutaryl-CoA dehydratase [Dehalococcoides mccartyi]